MNSTKISVIVPTYQHAQTICSCLDSIFAQTLKPFEVIVVNDGSTDNTVDVLAPYMSRITLINQENAGSNPARNRGWREAKGDFLIFCDADVIMRPHMLETMLKNLEEHPAVAYAYASFRFGWKTFRSFPFDADMLRRMNYIHTSSLVRREAFPGFDEKIKRLQDWDVWLTMLEQGYRGVCIEQELFKVIDDHGRKGISQWAPSFLYKIPWKKLGWKPKRIQKYEEAKRILFQKHGLS